MIQITNIIFIIPVFCFLYPISIQPNTVQIILNWQIQGEVQINNLDQSFLT